MTDATAPKQLPPRPGTASDGGDPTHRSNERSLRRMLVWSFAIVAVFFGGLGTWAMLAPLHSAAVATGEVVVEGNRKTVQHLEGGIVSEIRVDEGTRVEAGDVLVRLDPTQAKAQLDLLRSRQHTALAREARLVAERQRADSVTFPRELKAAASENPDVASMMESQRELFADRRSSLTGQIDILNRRMDRYREQIDGFRAQLGSLDTQAALISEEVASVQNLLERGLERRPRLLALQRRAAELDGSEGDLLARIAQAKQNIAESEARIIQLRNQRREEVSTRLRETRSQLFELEEQLNAQRDVVARTRVRAPRSGTVVDMQVHTQGGVIRAGDKIMDIVPSGEDLLVDARVRPRDIDVVRAGLPAEVRLTAYQRRTTPTIHGEVVSVSADRLIDEQTGEAYYTARVRIDQASLARAENVTLSPGMPAQVMIRTGERTALDYILSPIADTLNQAFREPS